MRDNAYLAPIKEIVWLGSSKTDLKAFPPAVMDDMGHQYCFQKKTEQTAKRDIDVAQQRLKTIPR